MHSSMSHDDTIYSWRVVGGSHITTNLLPNYPDSAPLCIAELNIELTFRLPTVYSD
jgi:hypothetical protein